MRPPTVGGTQTRESGWCAASAPRAPSCSGRAAGTAPPCAALARSATTRSSGTTWSAAATATSSAGSTRRRRGRAPPPTTAPAAAARASSRTPASAWSTRPARRARAWLSPVGAGRPLGRAGRGRQPPVRSPQLLLTLSSPSSHRHPQPEHAVPAVPPGHLLGQQLQLRAVPAPTQLHRPGPGPQRARLRLPRRPVHQLLGLPPEHAGAGGTR